MSISRRELLKGGVVTLAAAFVGCKTQQQNPNFINALSDSGIEFSVQTETGTLTGQGRSIPDTLRDILKQKKFTATFGFKDCDTMCPMTDQSLKHIGQIAAENNSDLVSVIISVRPTSDSGGNFPPDGAFMKKLKGKDSGEFGMPQKIMILYPTKNGKPLSDKEGQALMATLSRPLAGSNYTPQLHSPDIFLYGEDGNLISSQNGMAPNFDQIGAYLQKNTPKR